MHRLFALAFLVLAGCPPPPRYAVVEVYDPEPVQDALVATDCGKYNNNAMRTDDSGRARIRISGDIAPDRCVVTVAKPGYPTVQASSVQLCSVATACPATIVQLFSPYDAPVYERSYAEPPVWRAR
jgi:hypothetical protein